jgi:hypothetical protein
VLITNEFYEFCWFTFLGTSDDKITPYEPKSIHILIMSKTRAVHRQNDMRGRCGTRPGSSRPKVGLASPAPLADLPGPGAFWKAVFTTCQSKSVRRVTNVGKMVERLNLATRPSCMAGQPDKWASHAKSSATAPPYSSYKNPCAPPGRVCEESEV